MMRAKVARSAHMRKGGALSLAASHGLIACVGHGIESAILRMAASHELIAYGDLSGGDFVYWRHEFAILRMAASHGLVARATFPRVAAWGVDLSSPSCGWLPRMD